MSTGEPRPLPAQLHRIDDAVYAAERVVVVTTMLAMVLMVFFDVVDRRLSAPESKLAALLAALRVPAAGTLAPFVGGAILVGLIWFGFATVRRRRGSEVVAPALEPVVALGGTAILFALGWIMLHRPSNEFYTLIWVIAAGGTAVSALREKRDGWQLRVALGAVGLPVGGLFLWRVIPEGYSWAKEVAMILLLWTGFIGASMAAHQGRHVDIDFGKKMFPAALRMPVTVLAHLVTVAFCGLIVVLGMIYVFGENGLYRLEGRFPHTGIPDWTVAFAIPWSFGMIGLRITIAAIRVARGAASAKGSCPTPAPVGIGHGPPPKPGSAKPDAEAAP